MKKYICLFVIMIISIMIVGCLGEEASRADNSNKFKEEYESLNDKKSSNNKTYLKLEIPKDNPIKYSNADEIVNVIEKGSGVIYFGYPECPWCRSAVPSLLSAAKEAGIETIYYMNLKEERDKKTVDDNGTITTEKEASDDYKKLLKALDKYIDDYIIEDIKGNKINTNTKRIYVPVVVFVKDGQIIGIHADTVESQTDPYQGLNKEQTEELTLIYLKFMNKIEGNFCDENC